MDIAIIALLAIVIVLILIDIIFKSKKGSKALSSSDLKNIRESVAESINSLSLSISNNIALNNEKYLQNLVHSSLETNELVKKIGSLFTESYQRFDNMLTSFINNQSLNNLKQKEEMLNFLRDEIKQFNEEINKTLQAFNQTNKERLEDFKKDTKESLTLLNLSLEKNLKEIREDNNLQLDKINKNVNEKLASTLEKELKNSFDSVIAQIGHVNEAVGEIKGLANDVGSLKHVLTNVKTKGIVGEVILGNIIQEFLTKNQYEENVVTKSRGTERVEFAIKLPGSNDKEVLLPIDSKFALEPYARLLDSTDPEEIKSTRAKLRNNLLKYAKDVNEKYIEVPNTTDFAIIFLPLEGLYLEALEQGLFEEIQNKYRVNLTGPTTFTAFINALQIGFKSLAIEKKSADVFNLLRNVKREFSNFAEALEKTQHKMNDASEELEKLVGTRTRKLNVQLRSIEGLDEIDGE